MKINELPQGLLQKIRGGVCIPAHPLALKKNRRLDEKYQRALTRYYIDAGAGGIAVGVHTTQFTIRNPQVGLFEPVLRLASQTADEYRRKTGRDAILKVAGLCGKTAQAVKEAELAVEVGYHCGLLSLSAFGKADTQSMLQHCRDVAKVIPVFGFYLQPAVGGRVLGYEFWREFAEIENVVGIKIAPFDRYKTLDVVRAVCEAGREKDVALYTGNDDNILIDLLSEYRVKTTSGEKSVRIVGGLLGQWAVWTKRAVEMLARAQQIHRRGESIKPEMLTLAWQLTDANAAIFDAANSFAGCIAGIHEVLRRQGLMRGIWCLDEKERLSAGQKDQIERVCRAYPHLLDDDFVKGGLDKWLAD